MTKRVFLLLAALLVAFGSNLSAQNSFWVESFNTFSRSGEYTPQIDMNATHSITPKFGTFVWALVSKDWAEAIPGFTWSPTKSVEFDLGVGIETDPQPLRMLASVWSGNSRQSVFTAVEVGGSGYWYLVVLNRRIIKHDNYNIGIGFRLQRFAGIGPRVEVEFPKMRTTVWFSGPMLDLEDSHARNVEFGIKVVP